MSNLNSYLVEDLIDSSETVQKHIQQLQKEYGIAKHEAQQFYRFKGKLVEESNLAELKATAANASLSAKERAKAAKEAAAVERQLEEKAAKALVKFKETLYSRYDTARKVDYQKSIQEQEQEHRKSLTAQYEIDFAEAKALGKRTNEITRKYNTEKLASIKREREARAAQAAEEKKLAQEQAAQNKKNAENTKNALKSAGKAVGENIKAGNLKGSLKAIGAAAGATLGTISKLGETSIKDLTKNMSENAQQKADEANAKLAKNQQSIKDLEDKAKQGNKLTDEEKEELEKLKEEEKQLKEEAIAANNNASIAKTLEKATAALSDAYDKAFASAEDTMKSYQSHIDARLQGSDKSWKKANNMITSNLGLSTVVKTTNVIEKLKEAVDQGISYNVEQRAFLAEISDKIANTFNAFDASLLRLIKLQQADSTAARLGMEAMLTKFLNSTFEDSSYLSNEADQISNTIIDASSQLSNAQAAEFDYIVHKWLGSMSSVGISSEAINSIAEGINYLATGNVQSMASNTQLTTMFAMAASRSNMEYSELLLEGLDADKTNKLLEGMLSYLADIAKGADNQVVKGAYGNILNLKASDFKAIENLSSSISSIAANTASYGSMIAETESQLSSLWTKVSLSEQLSNVYDNAVYSVASDMVNNPVTWAMQKMLNFMDKNQLDINIPFINAMGFGVDLNTSVKGLMRVGMGLAQGFSFMGTLISSLTSGQGTSLGAWGAKETTSRGSGMSSSTSTSLGGTSSSVYVTNTNEQDVKNSTLNQATDDAEETKEITNKNTKSEKTFDDFYKATIGEPATEWIVTDERHLREVYRSSSRYLHTRDERMQFITEGGKASNYLGTYDPITFNLLQNTIDPSILSVGTAVSTFETTFKSYGTDGSNKLHVDDDETQSKLSTINTWLTEFKTGSFDDSKQLKVATSLDKLVGDQLATADDIVATNTGNIDKTLNEKLDYKLSTLDTDLKTPLDNIDTTSTTMGTNVSNIKTSLSGIIENNKIKTKLDNTVNSSNKLKVYDSDANTKLGGTLSVYDSKVESKLGDTLKVSNDNFSKITQLYTNGQYLKVEDKNKPSSTISGSVSVSNMVSLPKTGNAIRTYITNANDIKSNLTVKGGMNVSVDSQSVADGVFQALTHDTQSGNMSNSVRDTLILIHNLLAQGNAQVMVTNTAKGSTIPVRTNNNGNTWYINNFNT